MKTRLILKPGQKGTKRLTEKYGDALVCVRFRYDAELKQRLKTVELVVEKTDWTPPPMKYATDDLVPLHIEGYEKELRANPNCKKITLTASLYEINYNQFNQSSTGKHLHTWKLIPASKAQSFPDFIPKAIISDYNEACLIADLSPKASATLSRRCLQGVIRDFWQVKPGRLVDEIEQIQDKVDPMIWDAIDSVRKVGNIGAHMEKDIDLIVDVDPNEAIILIELIPESVAYSG